MANARRMRVGALVTTGLVGVGLGLGACGQARPPSAVPAPSAPSAGSAPSAEPAGSGSSGGPTAPGPLGGTDWTSAAGYRCPSDDQRVLVDRVVYGDITGDGVPDAVVTLTCSTTTSSNPLQVQAFDGASSPTHPRSLGVLFAGDDPLYLKQATVTIAHGGSVRLSGQALGPDAALAATPDIHVTQTFTYSNHALHPGPRRTEKK